MPVVEQAGGGTPFSDGTVAVIDRALGQAFPGVDPVELRDGVRVVDIRAGQALCQEGAVADVAWIVMTGRLRATIRTDDGPTTLRGHGPGQLVGEAALLEGGVRAATLWAVRDSRVMVLDRAWLRRALAKGPEVVPGVMATVLRHQGVREQPVDRVLTIVPGSPSVLGLAEGLAAAVCVGVDGAVVGPAHPGLRERAEQGDASWLGQLESEHEIVVLVADPAWTPWTHVAARSADQLVVLTDTVAGAGLSEVEASLQEQVARPLNGRRVLVLVHPSATARPSRTGDWLDERDVDLHLHLRRDREDDLARVARHLTGTAVALVLGGGGARAVAGLAVAGLLADRGVPVDVVTGSSAGAMLAGYLATGRNIAEASELTRRDSRRTKDVTLPVASVLRGRRAWRQIQESFDPWAIEDTWLPYACISTDLTTATACTHRRGRLADAIRASLSLPGVFPPVELDGHIHVDGGLVDNVPIDAARAIDPAVRVVAVDVMPPHGPRARTPIPRELSGWRLMALRLLPGERGPRLPSLIATVIHSTVVGARQRTASLSRDDADLHLRLNLKGYALLDFTSFDRIVEVGAGEAGPRIDAWLDASGSDVPRLPPGPVESSTGESRPGPSQEVVSRRHALAGAMHLAVEDLRHRGRRFGVAVVASAVVLALYLVMTGVVSQFHREPVVTVATIGGSHWVLPEGSPGPFTSNATFPEEVAADLVADGGAPLLAARYSIATADDDREVVLLGHPADHPGAPVVRDGRVASEQGEIAVSEDAELAVGDRVALGAQPVTVVGVVEETTVLAGMPLVFVPLEVARDLVVDGRVLASALALDHEPSNVPEGLRVVTAADIADGALQPLERPMTTLLLVRILLAVVATLIIGAVVFLATVERSRDLAVLRATGTGPRILAAGVAVQAVALALLASVLAVCLQVVLAPAFPMRIHLGVTDLASLPFLAAAIAAVASWSAIRRTLRVDPASAFSGPGG